MADLVGGALEAIERARAEGYEAGMRAGRQAHAVEVSIALRQMGIDLVLQAHRGGKVDVAVVLGNASGPGAVPPGGGR